MAFEEEMEARAGEQSDVHSQDIQRKIPRNPTFQHRKASRGTSPITIGSDDADYLSDESFDKMDEVFANLVCPSRTATAALAGRHLTLIPTQAPPAKVAATAANQAGTCTVPAARNDTRTAPTVKTNTPTAPAEDVHITPAVTFEKGAALATPTPLPKAAPIGSEDKPWGLLTAKELTDLRKRMKKGPSWEPSVTAVKSELVKLGRSKKGYRAAKDAAEAYRREFHGIWPDGNSDGSDEDYGEDTPPATADDE
jgi:hypothetical protein